jgi:hypothetical protein
MENWMFEGKEYIHDPAKKYFGFIYIIKNNINGMLYIGKKLFSKAGTKQVKGIKKKVRKESDWSEYWGSSPKLAEDIEKFGKENFSRTIVRLVKTRAEATYYETKLIFETDALLKKEYYNQWVSCKITEMHCNGFLKLYQQSYES